MPSPYENLIQKTAAKYGLPAEKLRAVMMAESSGNPRSVSRTGAVGLMQLMPQTAKMLGVKDSYDPAQNLDGGARYLAQAMKQYGGDFGAALAHYNGGGRGAKRYLKGNPYPETRAYMAIIQNMLGQSRGKQSRRSQAPTSGAKLLPSQPLYRQNPQVPQDSPLAAFINQLSPPVDTSQAQSEIAPTLAQAAAYQQEANALDPTEFEAEATKLERAAKQQLAIAQLYKAHAPTPQEMPQQTAMPQRQQVAAPQRPTPRTDTMSGIFAALGGLIAPQAAGQFAAQPLQAALRNADQQYADRTTQYELALQQANTQYGDQLREQQQQQQYTQLLSQINKGNADEQRAALLQAEQAGLQGDSLLGGAKTYKGFDTRARGAQGKRIQGDTATRKAQSLQDIVRSGQLFNQERDKSLRDLGVEDAKIRSTDRRAKDTNASREDIADLRRDMATDRDINSLKIAGMNNATRRYEIDQSVKAKAARMGASKDPKAKAFYDLYTKAENELTKAIGDPSKEYVLPVLQERVNALAQSIRDYEPDAKKSNLSGFRILKVTPK